VGPDRVPLAGHMVGVLDAWQSAPGLIVTLYSVPAEPSTRNGPGKPRRDPRHGRARRIGDRDRRRAVGTSFARRFWDGAYRDGEHLQHWQGAGYPVELAVLLAAGVIPPGGRVLDLGCGAGREVACLASLGLRAIGLDTSLEALCLARGSLPPAHRRLVAGDVFTLPLADASVDFVLDRGCLHGLGRRRRRTWGREVSRVLRPGGRLLIWGAARDDGEAGLVAVRASELDRLFPPPGFSRGPTVPCPLRAPAGDLPAHLFLLHRRGENGRGESSPAGSPAPSSKLTETPGPATTVT
jgi:SAM-dependent methyltransferase